MANQIPNNIHPDIWSWAPCYSALLYASSQLLWKEVRRINLYTKFKNSILYEAPTLFTKEKWVIYSVDDGKNNLYKITGLKATYDTSMSSWKSTLQIED